jgi:hypothetical protein
MNEMQEESQPLVLSDRDILIAIFNAVCALAERLTGDRLSVLCNNCVIYGSPAYAAFETNTGVAVADRDRASELLQAPPQPDVLPQNTH